MDVLQLVVSGLANGCIYGLIALGFVLIYKATEQVNFAQGDFMMLGAFVCLGLTNTEFLGWPFWVAVPLAILIMGAFGYTLETLVLRKMFGQPQVSVVILTIALGFVLRFFAGLIWGHEPTTLVGGPITPELLILPPCGADCSCPPDDPRQPNPAHQ